MGGALEKTSASGPMPTSRYCDHWPRATSASFSAMASAEPGRSRDRSEPIRPCRRSRIASAGIAARLFLDQAFQQADGEGDAGGLHRLQVARRQQAGRAAGQTGRQPVARVAQRLAGREPRQLDAVGPLQQVGHGRRHGGDVEHPAAAHRHHAGAVLRRLAPDTADQQSAVQVGGQVMIGNSGSSHAGSGSEFRPELVRSQARCARDCVRV